MQRKKEEAKLAEVQRTRERRDWEESERLHREAITKQLAELEGRSAGVTKTLLRRSGEFAAEFLKVCPGNKVF